MKTAMQELLSEMSHPNWDRLSFDARYEMFDKLLNLEKEQIMNAYNHNMTGFDKLQQEEIGLNWAEDYYNQTYNQNK